MPALPYSKKRYYLSGIDWIIGALNSYMCSTTPAGNHSTLILELENKIDEVSFQNRIDLICSSIPMLSSRIVRDLVNLAPYFKISKRNSVQYDFQLLNISSEKELDAVYQSVLNRPFSAKNCYLSFSLVNCATRSLLLMTFDHRILDARGAELFLNLLSCQSEESLNSTLREIKVSDAPQLKEWSDKFESGRTVQRKIITLTKQGCFTPSKFTMNNIPKSDSANLIPCFHSFSNREREAIEKKSEKTAGFMMETPYLLSVTAIAMFKTSESSENMNFFVPVPIDMRTKGEAVKRTFCNHLSFMFFYFKITPQTTLEGLICEIRKQLFTQIAEEFPENMIKAAYPGRIFPFWLLRRFMRFPFNGKMSSFVFANVGATAFDSKNIMGTGVLSLQHMPRIPTPPGVGIFFNQYRGRLNLTVTSDKNALRDRFGENLKENIVNALLKG